MDRLIVALDRPNDGEHPERPITVEDAVEIVRELDGLVSFFKVGWSLFMAEGGGMEVVRILNDMGKRVFLDLKYGDIPETVKRLIERVSHSGAEFITINSTIRAVEAAVTARNALGASLPKIFKVTLLTSQDDSDLRMMGSTLSAEEYVLRVAKAAVDVGCDGLICSAAEARRVREVVGPDRLIVTPGIRLEGHARDDHKRSATPGEAIRAGADYLVVGRPITTAEDMREAAERIIGEMEAAAR